MANLRTKYLGIELKNPIIVGASNLVTEPDIVKKLEKAGAAAIVYKSLFEEQIQLESYELEDQLEEYNERHAEMISLFPDIKHAGPAEHLHLLEKMKKSVSIPVIASLNCVYPETWTDYAKKLEETGVDALELNFYAVPRDFQTEGNQIVEEQIRVIGEVKKTVNIPVSVKLSPFYTNILKVVVEMDKAGADGFVLFNRLFQPDIHLEKEEHHYPYHLSHEDDNRLSLRFAGLLYDEIMADICSNTGIYSGLDVIKMILAGANAVQVVSTLYRNKPDHIAVMLQEMEQWMDKKHYEKPGDFRGKLSRKHLTDPFAYKRAQYVDILMKSGDIFKKYSMKQP